MKQKKIDEQREFETFVFDWLRKDGQYAVDCLNSDFVDAVIDKFKWKFAPMPYGAHKCSRLGKELSRMYKNGVLERTRVSLIEHNYGFPNWVYAYSLPDFLKKPTPIPKV